VLSVGLLTAGLTGGIYLGQDREVQQQDASASSNALEVEVDDMQLLKQRQGAHAAARAWRSQAEGDAAEKAAAEAKAAAGKAHALEVKVVEKKAAEKKAADEKKAKEAATESGGSSGPVAYTGDIPSSCGEYSGSRATGCALMLDAGFGLDQFPCLDKLWLELQGHQPQLRRVRDPAVPAGQQDGVGGLRLEDQPGHPDQVGSRLHRGPIQHALWCLVALAEQRLVLSRRL
jgi:hypothetical protein